MTAAVTEPSTAPSPRFRASRDAACGSAYACDGIEVGDRVGYVQTENGVVQVCASCADRTEAADELAGLAEPVELFDDFPALPAPTNVAEALLALQTDRHVFGQYRPETVDALVGLLDGAAEGVAAHERERWSWRCRQAARNGRGSLTPDTCAGLHMAASLIERNRETL